ncbi:MAG: hypothetical protein ABI435_07820 [Pseudolysinimonas sp.]
MSVYSSGQPPMPQLPQLPPENRHPLAKVLLISCGSIVVVVVLIVVGVGLWLNSLWSDAARQIAEDSPDPVPIYVMSERPGWQDMVDTVHEIYDRYDAALKDGTLINLTPVPLTSNPDYYKNFFFILTDEKSALRFLGDLTSTDPEDLDAQIAAAKDKTLETERRFLAGEDFETHIKYVFSDGTVYESDGTPDSPDGNPIAADPEQYARDFQPQTDANGTYQGAAELLAAQFGVVLNYDFSVIEKYCPTAEGSSNANVAAAFCGYSPTVVYVNGADDYYPAEYSRIDFIYVIKHELSHEQVFGICGTGSPSITGALNEGVANSYSVIYLGADYNAVQARSQGYPEYLMSPATDALAKSIHDGHCN